MPTLGLTCIGNRLALTHGGRSRARSERSVLVIWYRTLELGVIDYNTVSTRYLVVLRYSVQTVLIR